MSQDQSPDAIGADETATNEPAEALAPEELSRLAGEALPQRHVMSLIAPGSTTGTPAAALLPDEAMQWHGPPDEPHIM